MLASINAVLFKQSFRPLECQLHQGDTVSFNILERSNPYCKRFQRRPPNTIEKQLKNRWLLRVFHGKVGSRTFQEQNHAGNMIFLRAVPVLGMARALSLQIDPYTKAAKD